MSSASPEYYVKFLNTFSTHFNFIDNGMQSPIGVKNGMKGFVDFYGNVAPRLSMKLWDLFKNQKYTELDKLLNSIYINPMKCLANKDPGFTGIADGPVGKLRWEILGLISGPVFPAQSIPSQKTIDYYTKLFRIGNLFDWVDWTESVVK